MRGCEYKPVSIMLQNLPISYAFQHFTNYYAYFYMYSEDYIMLAVCSVLIFVLQTIFKIGQSLAQDNITRSASICD